MTMIKRSFCAYCRSFQNLRENRTQIRCARCGKFLCCKPRELKGEKVAA